MSYNHFYKQLESLALRLFPSVKEAGPVDWDHLISPLELRLPRSVLNKAQAAISALYAVSHRPSFVQQIEDESGMLGAHARNRSVLMAYDFHTNEAGDCFLVEVNTNASGFLLASLMEMTHTGTALADYQPLKDLRASFAEEMALSGKPGARIAITDEDVLQQKMLAEFLMYRDWFGQGGFTAEICESKQFTFNGGRLQTPTGHDCDFVYNRATDFYFQDPVHQPLRDAFLSGAACFSPNPREYWLLADKQRLVQLTQPGFMDKAGASEQDKAAIEQVLIPTFEKSAWASVDEIWHERRSLFFKPKRSFGGKSVYRGESVSKKVFERLMADDILIQKFQPAQRMPTDDPRSVLNNWKFDLRFFVYADRIQMAAARIYQGQVTNFSSPMGGFTRVLFEK